MNGHPLRPTGTRSGSERFDALIAAATGEEAPNHIGKRNGIIDNFRAFFMKLQQQLSR